MALLDSKMGEQVFAGHLAHLDEFDEKFIKRIKAGNVFEEIKSILKYINTYYKGNMCYIISENQGINGTEKLIEEAVKEVIAKSFGSVLSFIPGKLAYYSGESANTSLLFHKR